jgi:tyrosyl-tRNA synthetase
MLRVMTLVYDFINHIEARGLIAQQTYPEELREHLKQPRTAYVGIDPTAPSLHVGHLLPVMMLARWQRAGHRAIALMGGGTALVGDPTGKTELRSMLSESKIASNIEAIRVQLQPLLNAHTVVVNNLDWLGGLNYLEFLRDVGAKFSVNRMLSADCFRSRLEKGLSFLEFNYMILQAYDFLHLHQNMDCTLQLGGDDQWSNMLAGVDLIRREDRAKAFCLTNPLLTNSDGKKMGKTEQGAVWLDPNLCSPFDYFQFWRNMEDSKVKDCLHYFTFLDTDAVSELCSGEAEKLNEAKVVLAYECCKLIHGEEEAIKAKAATTSMFNRTSDVDLSQLPLPEVLLDLNHDITIAELMVLADLASSKGEARRLIDQGGVRLDHDKVMRFDLPVKLDLLRVGVVIFKGKKIAKRVKAI